MSFIEQYLLQLNTKKQRFRLVAVILLVLSLIVSLLTVWNLRMTGITVANDASCGFKEHQHTAECTENGANVCGITEHAHNIECYSDPKADVETAKDWEATLPELSGEKGISPSD